MEFFHFMRGFLGSEMLDFYSTKNNILHIAEILYRRIIYDDKIYEYNTIIQKGPDIDGAYIVFPYDMKAEFGKGRVKVPASFDGAPYDGNIINMGVKNPDGSILGTLSACARTSAPESANSREIPCG